MSSLAMLYGGNVLVWKFLARACCKAVDASEWYSKTGGCARGWLRG
jgi:hypothetical protein